MKTPGFNKGRLTVERRHLLRSQDGFTLIEIISVLVLLGILAAVAVPKFFNLQTQARIQAVNAALAEGVSQVNQASAKFLLINGTPPVNLTSLTGLPTPNNLVTPYNPSGSDFTLTFANATGHSIRITATGNPGTTVASAKGNKTIPLPR